MGSGVEESARGLDETDYNSALEWHTSPLFLVSELLLFYHDSHPGVDRI